MMDLISLILYVLFTEKINVSCMLELLLTDQICQSAESLPRGTGRMNTLLFIMK